MLVRPRLIIGVALELKFGPWARLCELQIGAIHVRAVADAEQVLENLKTHSQFSKGWIYPPLTSPFGDARSEAPRISATSYSLPPTHDLCITGPYETDSFADFLIALVGLLDGVRLTRDGWRHFFRAPVELHKLGDLVVDRRELAEVVRLSSEFWLQGNDEIRSRLFGAIHWIQFSELMDHDFERFGAAYTSLDTLYWIYLELTGKPKVPHAHRLTELAQYYGIAVPAWGIVSGHSSRISELRNELVHEARYAGAPTGFAHPSDYPMISMELRHVATRILLGMLRVPCGYVGSVCDSRQMHGLDFMGPLQAV